MQKGKISGNGSADKDPKPDDARLARLPKLASRITSAKAKVDEARAAHGALWSQAESDGYHRRALKEALRLRDMEPDARRDYLTALTRYCETLEVFAQGELFEPMPHPPQQPEGFTAGENGDALLRARELGRQARLRGVVDQTLYELGSAEATAWFEAWTNTAPPDEPRRGRKKLDDLAASQSKSGRRRRGRPAADLPEA